MVSFWVSLTLGVIVALIALGGVAVNTALEDGKIRQAADKPIIIHMHAELKIIIHGEPIIVPELIGIDPVLYNSHALDKYGIKNPRIYPLHTHNTSGVIHIESTVIRTFTLGEFFDVWGKTFNEKCIMDKCSDGLNKVRMYVDGSESFEFGEHVLSDGEVITIEYGSPAREGIVEVTAKPLTTAFNLIIDNKSFKNVGTVGLAIWSPFGDTFIANVTAPVGWSHQQRELITEEGAVYNGILIIPDGEKDFIMPNSQNSFKIDLSDGYDDYCVWQVSYTLFDTNDPNEQKVINNDSLTVQNPSCSI